MKIFVDESPTGSGKTYRAINYIAENNCKSIFITERIESFDELERDIRRAAGRHGTHPQIRRVHGGCLNWGNSVSREIEHLPVFYGAHDHVIVLATHAALLRSDFSEFAGWRLIIDEVPQFLDFEDRETHLDVAFFQRYYCLTPIDEKWSSIKVTEAGKSITVANVLKDQSHSHLAVFHSRVIEASRLGAKRQVLCNLTDWDEMSDPDVQWCWASVFSLHELEKFDRVEMLGNRFRRDIGFDLTRFFAEDVKWEALDPLPYDRAPVHRKVHIHYFTDARQASRTYFESPEGQVALSQIGQRLSSELPADGSIWSANNKFKDCVGLPESTYCKPKQAGTNKLMRFSHAAMIYSSKPSANHRGLLNVLKIDTDKWTKSIEHETILQFSTRTSLRDPDSAAPIHIWVFDQQQAIYLKNYFDESLSYVTASCDLVVDGPVISPCKQRGRKSPIRTPAEQLEFKVEKRRRDAARKRRERAKKKKAA